jgi:hypothetical protein
MEQEQIGSLKQEKHQQKELIEQLQTKLKALQNDPIEAKLEARIAQI